MVPHIMSLPVDGKCSTRRHPAPPGYFCPVRAFDNTINAVLQQYHLQLEGLYEPSEVRAIVRAVFADRMGMDTARLELDKEKAISESELLSVYLPLKRLRAGEPLQYVLGKVLFHGLELEVGPGVLVPRPETEEMVDLIIRSGIVPRCIVDVGTGSGAIALALKKAYPAAVVHGVDVSPEALALARRNGQRTGLEVHWHQQDILARDAQLPRDADLVVSNPPYIPRSEEEGLSVHVREHEPYLALFVDTEDPTIFYRVIGSLVERHVIGAPHLWFEGHHQFVTDAAAVLRGLGYGQVDVIDDLSGTSRFIHALR